MEMKGNSREAESFRGLRTALYFSTQGEGHKVVQVTSPDPGDGKTTLVANLGVSIAQSGKRILLIDADCRRPRQHRIFNVDASVGLVSVLKGEAELSDAVQETEVVGLSVLPSGPHQHNPAELLTSPEFQDLVELLREQYDFVLLDTPPILVVTDPSVVAPRVDGVLITIRVRKNGRPSAMRAADALNTLGAKILGVVVNGVGGRPGYGQYGHDHYGSSYGYGGYKYGYRGYGYGYGYGGYSYSGGYGDQRYGGYYADDDAERASLAKSKRKNVVNGNQADSSTNNDANAESQGPKGDSRGGPKGWFRK